MTYEPPKGEPPEMTWLDCSDLQIDPDYQRSIDNKGSQNLIRRIAVNWDWRLCAPLTVSLRTGEDGAERHFVIDGQHRMSAAKLRGDIPQLPCIVSVFASREEEAAAFVGINTERKAVTKLDQFFARLVAGNAAAKAAKAVIDEAGLTVPRNNDPVAWQRGDWAFPWQIERMLKDHKGCDPDCVDALKILHEAYQVPLLRGFYLFPGVFALLRKDWGQIGIEDLSFADLSKHIGSKRQNAWIVLRDQYMNDRAVMDHGEAMAEVLLAGLPKVFRRAAPPPPPKPKPVTFGPPPSAPPPPQRKAAPVWDEDGKTFCGQCDRRVTKAWARSCISQFCKVK